MPKVFRAPNPHSLVHQAIEKAGGIKRLSECVHLSPRTVAQWVKVDRISNKHILHVCHAADVEPLPLLAYIERKKKPWFFKAAARKENALATLTRLQQGEISLAEARETDSGRLVPLLTSNLIPFGVTFEAAASWSVFHQAALAEILNALPEQKTPIFRPGEAIKSGFQPKFSLKKAAK